MKEGFLCVANWDSNVGYAWWLMEGFWVQIGGRFDDRYRVYLSYPSISKLPDQIKRSRLEILLCNFGDKSLTGLLRQIKIIRGKGIRIIYFSDKPFYDVRYLFYRLAGVKKIIVHDHTPGLRSKPQGIKKIFKLIRARIPWANCDVLIGATGFVRNRAVEVGCFPPAKCYAAPNGIPENRVLYDLPGGEPDKSKKESILNIVTVGRMSEYKGVYFALSVFDYLINILGQDSFHYTWIGDGPELQNSKNFVNEKGLSGHVTLLGKVPNPGEFLCTFDVAFHPSKGEVGYSLSILEYMQAGLGVIVPNNPSVSSATIHEETGYIYPEGDIKSAASLIDSIIQGRRDVRIIGEKAHIEVCEKYKLADTHNKLLEILQKNTA